MTTSPVMTITDEVLAELEAAADEASQGPWRDSGCGRVDAGPGGRTIARQYGDGLPGTLRRGYINSMANAAHIALNNPSTTKALLRHIAELKERCATAEKDAERYAWIRDQHNDGMGRTWVAVYQPGGWVSLDTFVAGEKSDVLNLDMAVDAAIQSQGEMS